MVMKVCLALALVGIALAAPSKKSETSILSATKSESASTASSQRRSSDGPSASSRRLLSYGKTVSKISPTYGPMEGNSLVMIEAAEADSNPLVAPLGRRLPQLTSTQPSSVAVHQSTLLAQRLSHCLSPAQLPPAALSPSPISQPCTCRISRPAAFSVTMLTPVPSSMSFSLGLVVW